MIEFTFAGGALEVGGSCIYVRVGEYGILMDSGIRQTSGRDPLPDFRSIQTAGGVDAILISHAHMDHIGSLPVISKAYPNAPIYMTKMTADLSRVLLYDSLKIMDRREEEIPHYSEPDVKGMLNRIRVVKYLSPMEILPKITVTMYPAGHIAGAACLNLATPEGTIFYSGDVSSFSQRTIEGARIPKLRPDVAILESTYGNRIHANRQVEEKHLIEIVAEYLQKKAPILIPAFALGRAQEVLLILRSAMQNKEIPEVPVFVDGMVRDINRVYTQNPTFLKNALAKRILKGFEPFYTEQIREVKPSDDRNVLLEKHPTAIYVSSSGMLTGGPSLFYAKKLLPMENACIIITGYQDEEAPGRTLLNLLDEGEGDRKITLDGTVLPVRCHVEQVGLSAHADQSELTGIIDYTSARRIILVHGDSDAIEALGKDLTTDIRRQIFQPTAGDRIEMEIRSKRKQRSIELPFSLQRFQQAPGLLPKESGCKELWEYWGEHYQNRTMTMEQAAFLWSGKKDLEEEFLSAFQEALLESPYFSRDLKRLYLLRPNTIEEIEEERKKSEATIQDVEAWIRSHYHEKEIRKLGFYPEGKRVVLSFDFPDTVDRTKFEECSVMLQEFCGWTMTLSTAMNYQAASGILQGYFGTDLQKVSYYEAKKEYHVTTGSEPKDLQQISEAFYRKTGWKLVINGASAASSKAVEKKEHADLPSSLDDGWFFPKPDSELQEQNLALSCLEQSFRAEECSVDLAPYKTGIKTDMHGKYMELSFLSPALGKRCGSLLQTIADQIGWRLHISESVNQNQLTLIALELCEAFQIHPAKNPSYLPGEQAIRLKCPDIIDLPEQMKEEFFRRTGCRLVRML